MPKHYRTAFLAYLFDKPHSEIPTLHELSHLRPEDAFWIVVTSRRGFTEGNWKILGQPQPRPRRSTWPVPLFGRVAQSSEDWEAAVVPYCDNGLEPTRKLFKCDPLFAMKFPCESALDHVTLDQKIESYLRSGTPSTPQHPCLFWIRGLPDPDQTKLVLGEIAREAKQLVLRNCPQGLREGDWFAVRTTFGYVRGLVLRYEGKGPGMIACFFDGLSEDVPPPEAFEGLTHDDAFDIVHTSTIGFRDSDWRVVCRPKQWSRKEWTVPPFGWWNPGNPDRSKLRTYDDVNHCWGDVRMSATREMVSHFPSLSLPGYDALVRKLELYFESKKSGVQPEHSPFIPVWYSAYPKDEAAVGMWKEVLRLAENED